MGRVHESPKLILYSCKEAVIASTIKSMGSIHKLLNIVLPLITWIVLPIFLAPFLVFKLLLSVKMLVCRENLAGKVALITGAASGIGEQLAYEYAKGGAVLSLVDVKKDNLGAVADKAKSLGSPDVIMIGADVSKAEDCKRFVDETVNYFGRLDHLVNNAGISGRGLVENFRDVAVFAPIMDVNFWGPVYGTVFAIPHLKRSKGKIVVIASACGWYPLPRLGIYNASKAALINFFETVRMELGSTVGITIVTPGLTKSGLTSWDKLSQTSMGFIPKQSAAACARAIIDGVRKGKMYVTEPSWIKVLFPWKLLCPQVIDMGNRLAFGVSPNAVSRKIANENVHLPHKIDQPKAE